MEGSDEVQTLRSRRPESSASSRSKFSPQSSNSSSTNFQVKNIGSRMDSEWSIERGNTERAPSGSLLQERLREKKAARLSEKRNSMDLDTLQGDRGGVQSSPVGFRTASRAGRDKDVRRPSSSGKVPGERVVGKKGMGIKEMEETVSNLHKKNFDLKLELYHRRQRQNEMEERLEAAEKEAADATEIQLINEQLVAELEKRDQAVEEAVGIICTLEEKIERLMREREIVRTIDAEYETSYSRVQHTGAESETGPPSSPPHFDGSIATKAKNTRSQSRRITRMPSFLSEHGEGAEALRSLYLPSNHEDSQSALSLPRLREENVDDQEDGMNSPRLSMLSKSSFVSVYGEKSLALEGLDLDEGSIHPAVRRHRKSLSVEKWVDSPSATAALLKPSPARTASPPMSQYMSINHVLESPLQRLEKLHRKLSRQNESLASSRPLSVIAPSERPTERELNRDNKRDTLRRTELTAFDHQSTLPPTPDTISTSTLRRYKNSSDTLHRDVSSHQEQTELPHLDRSFTLPSHTNLIRPRSACETVTSRREGHGWDTVTQSETSTNSEFDVEVESTSDPWIATSRDNSLRTPIQPPDMFTFNDGSDDEQWGRDIMFNRDDGHKGYDPMTALRSDDTIQQDNYRSRKDDPYQLPVLVPALDASPKPSPPERRSSLAAYEKKLRKQPPTQNVSKINNTASPNPMAPTVRGPSLAPGELTTSTPPSTLSRMSRFLGRNISIGSGRTDTRSSPAAPQQPQSATHPTFNRSQTYNHAKRLSADLNLDLHAGASATPPPISRYPRGGSSGGPAVTQVLRPSSAGGYGPGGRRSSVIGTGVGAMHVKKDWPAGGDPYGVDGTFDERSDAQGQSQGQQGGKKWFGLSRNGSLRR